MSSRRLLRSYPLGTYSSDSDPEGAVYFRPAQVNQWSLFFHRLFLNFILYIVLLLLPAALLTIVVFTFVSLSSRESVCQCAANQYNYAPQRPRGGRYGDSKKGRTVDSYFCPHCGSRYRPSLSTCPSLTCGKPLPLKVRCGNCQPPREDPLHRYCRYCGLSYAEVGVVRPVRTQRESSMDRQPETFTPNAASRPDEIMVDSS